MIYDHLHFSGKGNIMDHNAAAPVGTIIATSTLGAYVYELLPAIAAGLSIIWLSLQIGDFLWKKYKFWRRKNGNL